MGLLQSFGDAVIAARSTLVTGLQDVIRVGLLIFACLGLAAPTRAQTWPSRPITMIVPVFMGEGRLEMQERPTPQIKNPDDVRLRVEACGLCGTDLNILAVPPGHKAEGASRKNSRALTRMLTMWSR